MNLAIRSRAGSICDATAVGPPLSRPLSAVMSCGMITCDYKSILHIQICRRVCSILNLGAPVQYVDEHRRTSKLALTSWTLGAGATDVGTYSDIAYAYTVDITFANAMVCIRDRDPCCEVVYSRAAGAIG